MSHGKRPTKRPWAWEANGPHPGDITLGGAADPTGQFHILTPHICESCRESGHTCLAPSPADAALIVKAVNAYDHLKRVERAAIRWLTAYDTDEGAGFTESDALRAAADHPA